MSSLPPEQEIELAPLPVPAPAAPLAPTLSPSAASSSSSPRSRPAAIPPADGGRAAWSYLAGAFLVEAMVWGFPYSYSIFQEFYIREGGPFEGDQGLITLAGTLSSGVTYMSGIVLYPVLERKPHWRRRCMWLGFAAMIGGLVGSGFARSASAIVVTQGLLFGLGGSILYAPVVTYMNEWFVVRRGLAYGVITAGTSISGIVFPFIIQSALSRFGFRPTLWALGLALALLIGPLLPFIRGRLPVQNSPTTAGEREEEEEEEGELSSSERQGGSEAKRLDYSFLAERTFWILWLCNLVQALGYFLPTLFLPLYARKVAPDDASLGSTSIVVVNAAAIVSRLLFGALSDSPKLTLPLVASSALSSSAAVLLVWGLAGDSPKGLLGFAVAYGVCSGGFSSLWGGMARRIGTASPAQASNLYGLFSFGRGLGNVLSAPISTALLTASPLPASYGQGEYGKLILFTGASLAVAGVLGGLGAAGKAGGGRRRKEQ